MKISAIEWAGRFDRSDNAFMMYLRALASQGTRYFLLTEASQRVDVLANFAKNGRYSVVQGRGDGSECAILYMPEMDQLIYSASPRTTEFTFRRDSGKEARPNHCTTAVFDTLDGARVMVTVDHNPSSVEGRSGFRGKVDRIRAYRAVQRGWKKHIREVVKKYNPDVVLIAADWNLNWRKRWVRTYMKHWLTIGAMPIWTPKRLRGQRGTFKTTRRVIDGFLVIARNGYVAQVGQVQVLPRTELAANASDHNAVKLVLNVFKKGWK